MLGPLKLSTIRLSFTLLTNAFSLLLFVCSHINIIASVIHPCLLAPLILKRTLEREQTQSTSVIKARWH